MSRRILIVVVVVLAVLGVAVGAVLVAADDSESTVDKVAATAEVRKTDLTRTEAFSGVVAYQDLRGLSAATDGVITWLPAVGQTIASGQVLMSVDAQPVVLLTGALPAWRDLGPDIEDGPDVAQLEAALLALGFGTGGPNFPNEHWGQATTNAVTALQKQIGAVDDGTLSLGEVVFTAESVHVAKHEGHVGGMTSPGAPVLSVQSTERVVTIEVDPVKRDLVTQGAPVNVELPGGDTIAGTVASVSTTLTQNADGKGVFTVTVTLDDPAQVADLALAPVTVHYVATVAQDVIAVPVAAIVGVPGGGYAVDVVGAGGKSKRVPVKLGAWGDGYVAVTGELKAGTKVEVPA